MSRQQVKKFILNFWSVGIIELFALIYLYSEMSCNEDRCHIFKHVQQMYNWLHIYLFKFLATVSNLDEIWNNHLLSPTPCISAVNL